MNRTAMLLAAFALAGVADVRAQASSAEQDARKLLASRHLEISAASFAEAIGDADPTLVIALLDAGVRVGPNNADRASVAVVSGLATACAKTPVAADRIDLSLTLLVQHGFPVGYADNLGNTVLLSAAQFCPAAIVQSLLKLGADADPMNKQQFTPLMMALVSGKWDVAEVLVEHGARVTPQQSNQIFFEKPQDPSQRALLARATK